MRRRALESGRPLPPGARQRGYARRRPPPSVRQQELPRVESGDTARRIRGMAPALLRSPRPNRPAPARATPLPGSWGDSITDDHPSVNSSGRGPVPASYPIRQTTTPVPVEGGVEGGALPKSAGTSFHGRRKPNGSACQRRTMAGVQDETKHAMSAISPSSCRRARVACAHSCACSRARPGPPARQPWARTSPRAELVSVHSEIA